jgi:hypothetical protein
VPHWSTDIAAKLVLPFRLEFGHRPSDPGQPNYLLRLVLVDRSHHSIQGCFDLQGFGYLGFISFVKTAVATLDWHYSSIIALGLGDLVPVS